jgi:hypothetical protein
VYDTARLIALGSGPAARGKVTFASARSRVRQTSAINPWLTRRPSLDGYADSKISGGSGKLANSGETEGISQVNDCLISSSARLLRLTKRATQLFLISLLWRYAL